MRLAYLHKAFDAVAATLGVAVTAQPAMVPERVPPLCHIVATHSSTASCVLLCCVSSYHYTLQRQLCTWTCVLGCAEAHTSSCAGARSC